MYDPWDFSPSRMIGWDYTQYGFWLVELFFITQSCERSLLQKSHTMTYMNTAFYNSESMLVKIVCLSPSVDEEL